MQAAWRYLRPADWTGYCVSDLLRGTDCLVHVHILIRTILAWALPTMNAYASQAELIPPGCKEHSGQAEHSEHKALTQTITYRQNSAQETCRLAAYLFVTLPEQTTWNIASKDPLGTGCGSGSF